MQPMPQLRTYFPIPIKEGRQQIFCGLVLSWMLMQFVPGILHCTSAILAPFEPTLKLNPCVHVVATQPQGVLSPVYCS